MTEREKMASQDEAQLSQNDADAPADFGSPNQADKSEAEVQAELKKVVNENDMSEADAEAAMMAMLEDLPQDSSKAAPEDIHFGMADVSRAEFQHLSEPAAKPAPRNIDLLMDVSLPIAIELGRTRMSISDILALGPGSVVELNKLAGEPVDVLVNGKIVAKGEVVVIDENFGVRVTQLMTPEERLKLLADEQ